MQVVSQLQVPLKLINLRNARDGIFVTKLIEPEAEFVTSDNPVVYSRVGLRFTATFNLQNVLSLPLNKKHKLMLMPYADRDTRNLIIRNSVSGEAVSLICMNNSELDQKKADELKNF